MKIKPPPFAIFFLALLLLQVPSLMAWSQSIFGGESHDIAMTMAASEEQHYCHDNHIAPFVCEEMGCAFCVIGIRFDTPGITAFITHVLQQPAVTNPAAPQLEQPVELRPPRHLHSV